MTAPTTIAGVKRLAKRIKAELGIPHHEALNHAAQKAGYNNFADAHRRMP